MGKIIVAVFLIGCFNYLAGEIKFFFEEISWNIMNDRKGDSRQDPIERLIEKFDDVKGSMNESYVALWKEGLKEAAQQDSAGGKVKAGLGLALGMLIKTAETGAGGVKQSLFINICYRFPVMCTLILFLLQGLVQCLMVAFAPLVIPFFMLGNFGTKTLQNYSVSLVAVFFIHPTAIFFMDMATHNQVIETVSAHSNLFVPCAYFITIGLCVLLVVPAFVSAIFYGGSKLMTGISHTAVGSAGSMARLFGKY